MNGRVTAADLKFIADFQHCQLDPDNFNHKNHIRLAWIHLEQYGLEKAINNIQSQLKKYVRFAGAEEKYHETLTIAAVYTVHHFRKKSKAQSFEAFISEFPRLTSNFKELIETHYSNKIISSPIAKQTYIQPDLLPFS